MFRFRLWVVLGSRLGEGGKPGVDYGALGDFFEFDTHTYVELAVNDAADGGELLILVSDVDSQKGAGGQRVEHVEIAAFATNVAGAGRKAGFGASLDNLG